MPMNAQDILQNLANEIDNNRVLIGRISDNNDAISKAMSKGFQKLYKSMGEGYNTLATMSVSQEPMMQGYPRPLVEFLERARYINPQKKDPDFTDMIAEYFTTGNAGHAVTGIESEKQTPVGKVIMGSPVDVTSAGYPLSVLANIIGRGYGVIKDSMKESSDIDLSGYDKPLFTSEEMQILYGPRPEPKIESEGPPEDVGPAPVTPINMEMPSSNTNSLDISVLQKYLNTEKGVEGGNGTTLNLTLKNIGNSKSSVGDINNKIGKINNSSKSDSSKKTTKKPRKKTTKKNDEKNIVYVVPLQPDGYSRYEKNPFVY